MESKKIKKFLVVSMSAAMVCSVVPAIKANEDSQTGKTATNNVQLIPEPKQMELLGSALDITKTVNIQGADVADADAVRILNEYLQANGVTINETYDDASTTLILGEADDEIADMDAAKQKLGVEDADSLKEEGYVLAIDDADSGTIIIEGKDGDGTFYGVQTLKQLIEKRDAQLKAETVRIVDEPTMKTRGSIEGFYGNPWSNEDRADQIVFYGQNKMNTYIYAPKDDPYHREKWREPYPENEMARMTELISLAKANKVDFVFGVSPGNDIHFDGANAESDFQALVSKCQSLYDMGVRSFAIFYDDISNKQGVKQAAFLNRFNEEFIKVKKDIKPLITVPTEYDTNAMGAGTVLNKYTSDFSTTLDADIKVLWTGSAVVPEGISVENAQYVKSIYGDRVGIWWNYPVTDYIQNKLALGPIYGLDKGLQDELDFFVMNPMEHAELSKISLATGADYAWNTSAYDYESSFDRSINELYGDLAPAMKIFADHSTRMEAGWASTGRKDAPAVRDLMDTVIKEVAKGLDAQANIDALMQAFDDMISSADTLLSSLTPAQLSHCSGNLNKLKALGENDKLALELLLAKNNGEEDRVNELSSTLRSNLYSLQSGKLVSEKTALSFINEILAYDTHPSAGFEISNTFVAPGQEIQLTNTSSVSSTDMEWTCKGANVETSTDENPIISYAKEGVYTVTLKAKNALGEDVVVKENAITVSKEATNEVVNLSVGKTATASGYTAASEAPGKAIDGIDSTKWCATGSRAHTLTIDLGTPNTISNVIIKHAEVGGEGSALNTRDYRLLVSLDGTNFTEVKKVTGNTAGLTNDAIPVSVGRYVRLIVDKATQGNDTAARIYEVEVMGLDHAIELPPVYKDASGLQAAYDNAVKKEQQGYDDEHTTPSSWTVYFAAMKNANAVLHNDAATQGDIDEALTQLQAAVEQLAKKATAGQFSSLALAVQNAETIYGNDTDPMYNNLKAAVAEAKALLGAEDKEEVTFDAAEHALDAIRKAKDELAYNPVLDALKILVAEAKKADTTDVRPEKIEALQEAIAAAEALIENNSTDGAAVSAASNNLYKALQELYEIVDKEDLQSLIVEAETLTQAKYTESSWNIFADALGIAKTIAADDNATSGDVKQCHEDLLAAIAQLQLAANKDALRTHIDIVKKMLDQIDNYVPSTVFGLQDVWNEAKAVLDNEDASQADIDTAVNTLIEAAAKARLKADKQVLTETLQSAKGLKLSNYKNGEAVAQAMAAAEAVLANETATQMEVDAANQTLQQAIDALVPVTGVQDQKPSTHDKPKQPTNTSTKNPSTGDETKAAGLAGIVMLAGAAMAAIRRKRTKTEK